jgi:gamma-glutamyltranspeptidase
VGARELQLELTRWIAGDLTRGRRAFYEGSIAKKIVPVVKMGGIWTMEDLRPTRRWSANPSSALP